MIDEFGTYKYLGIEETKKGTVDKSVLTIIANKIESRAEAVVKTNLNAKNMFLALNERAMSLIDYPIGICEIAKNEASKIDTNIRKILQQAKIHIISASKQRLYIPRKEMG